MRKRWCGVAKAAAATLALVPVVVAAAETSIADWFRPAQYASPRLSPDGRRIGLLAPRLGRQNLFVYEIASRTAQPVTAFDDVDVTEYEWISDRRLTVRTGSLAERDSDVRASGYFAVDADGTQGRRIWDPPNRNTLIATVFRWNVPVRVLPGDRDDIVVQEMSWSASVFRPGALYMVNTRAGTRTPIVDTKPDEGEFERWIVDRDGVARTLSVQRGLRTVVHYRADAESPWQVIADFQEGEPGLEPIAIEGRDTLIVMSRRQSDRAEIFRYDASGARLGEKLASSTDADLTAVIQDENDAILGIPYRSERQGVAWLDPRLVRVQKGVDGALPGRHNSIVSWSRALDRFVVASSSDGGPRTYYLLDASSAKLEWLADSRPWIEPARVSPMRAVRYAAADGLTIPAILTIPAGGSGRGLPLVVIPHGGPYVPGDDLRFDPEAQFLASRGYAVLQPNFRGTTGRGWRHYAAGKKQWGFAMQDDLADGARWAIAQGIADPKRVAIAGASYGGYAALMGMARTPDLFRCAVAALAPTNLVTLVTIGWADYSRSQIADASNRDRIGDPDKDRARLEAASPALLAERFRGPVLLAYGAQDRRVPISHGYEMKSALDRAGKRYEWIALTGEGHGFRDPANVAEFYGAVERFLGDCTKPP